MDDRNWAIISIAAAFLLLTAMCCPAAAKSKSYTFTSFDFPGALDTGGNGISPSGKIVGNYFPGFHGFLNDNGVFTTIDVPFADATLTSPQWINPSGQIVGYYETGEPTFFIGPDTRGIHGYLDDRGVFTTIDVPLPGALPDWTVAGYILPGGGSILGVYLDRNIVFHGFLKKGDVFNSIDVPFSGALATLPSAMTPSGQIVGVYADSNGALHGFLENHSAFTTFDVPFAGASLVSINSINPQGKIDGVFADGNGVPHGFVDDRGAFIQVDAPFPGATTFLAGNNTRGQITGTYFDTGGTAHGFVATPSSAQATP